MGVFHACGFYEKNERKMGNAQVSSMGNGKGFRLVFCGFDPFGQSFSGDSERTKTWEPLL